jgi:hypothetical protein
MLDLTPKQVNDEELFFGLFSHILNPYLGRGDEFKK